jgi:2,3,4,5-tetrahydropyridine-2-carboxylate N-succinyltransferase
MRDNLQTRIEELFDKRASVSTDELNQIFNTFVSALNSGKIRAAIRNSDGEWTVNAWVKKGILLLFQYGMIVDFSHGYYSFFDKHTVSPRRFTAEERVRIVPGGSSIRNGSYVAPGVICMPPMFINIGAYIDEGTMVDSHALVGTCAQIGKRVHLSAAAQIGGVLEPPGARPVIIEDDVLIGGNCGVYEGTIVRKRAVLASGVILTASVKVFDLVNEKIIAAKDNSPLEIPENAVLVQGSRLLKGDFAEQNGLSISSPIIIKYRDDKTDAKTALEAALR